jgi:hypothetical protein
MPFLAGLISPQPPDVCQRLVDRMATTMLHEKFYVTEATPAPSSASTPLGAPTKALLATGSRRSAGTTTSPC